MRLIAAGIPIKGTGRWLGELVDGAPYDWFLRTESEVKQARIAPIIGEVPVASDAEARTAVLEQQLMEVRAELRQLGQSLIDARRPLPPPEITSLEFDAPSAVEDANALFVEAQRRIDDLEQRLSHVIARAPAPPPRLIEEIDVWLNALRPDIGLLRSGGRVLMGEYHGRGGFLRSILELPVEGGQPRGSWKSVQGASKWWERHVSTGQDDSGRVYARYDTSGRRWDVLVSWKSEQQADIAWLKRQ